MQILKATPFKKAPLWQRAAPPVGRSTGRRLAVSGLSMAGALLAASAASAATTAARRRSGER